ncbi:MAG: radical SAM protein [Deltaproteobacteria bacterium]|nr:MAG: radical SAM protein [Deltaproteobacteria bacterium]
MTILLVNPANAGILRAVGVHFPPMGPLYLGAYLEREGYHVEIRDFCTPGERPRYSNYGLVGISTDTTRHLKAMEIARRAKEAGCTVVMGGPHTCYIDEEVLGSGWVDFIIHGEGEVTLLELVKGLEGGRKDWEGVKGLSFQRDGEVVRTPPRPFIQDLDSLPLPARNLLDMDLYRRTKFGNRDITPAVTSRGCPVNCNFCSSSSFFGTRWRARSPVSVVEELEELHYTYGFGAVAFVDDNFTLSPQRVVAISEKIIRKGLDIWWWNFSRVEEIVKNEEMLEVMKKAGARTIYLGVESANPQTLADLGKKMDLDMVTKAIGLLKRHGFEIFASYILGNPMDTVEDIHETIRFAKRLDTNVAQFSILTPYPGTAIYEQLKEMIWTRHWPFYDSQHLVYRHKYLSFIRMEWLLLKANLLYYTRSKKAMKDVWRVAKRHKLGLGTLLRFIRDYFWGK